jgi:hypothetical protein
MATAPLESPPKLRVRPLDQELTSCKVVEVHVTVSGQDLSGEAFVDQCKTIAVAHNGGIVTINRTLGIEQEVFLRHGDQELVSRVTGHSGLGNYGLCFSRPDPEFWGDILAPPPPGTDPLLVANFEQFGQAMTAEVKREPNKPLGERRRTPRISMRQAKACVESSAGVQDVVELVNISRGGLCFRSDRSYPLRSCIRVAAPYTPDNTNVFVQGKIVRITREVWGNLYGVEYVRQ